MNEQITENTNEAMVEQTDEQIVESSEEYQHIPWYRKPGGAFFFLLFFIPGLLAVTLTGDIYTFDIEENCYKPSESITWIYRLIAIAFTSLAVLRILYFITQGY